MAKKEKSLPDDQVATQRNDLLHGQQSLSLVQKRIFALAIQKIRRDDDDLKTYTIEIQDLVEAGTSENIFSKIEQEAENLMRKILLKKEEIEGSRFPKTTRWSMISKAVHNPGKGTLDIRIDSEIRDMLISLKEQGNFTAVPVAEILACRSTYGQRLYELLYSQAWKGNKWEVSLDELRFSLNAEDKYPNFSHFRSRILKKAQKDIHKNTNMTFTWEEEKRGKGRKITHLIFEYEIVADQLDLPLSGAEKKSDFDIYNLRDRLKKWAKLEKEKINKIMWYLENNPDDRETFKQQYHEVEVNLQQGTDEQGRTINSHSGYAWTNIKPLIEN